MDDGLIVFFWGGEGKILKGGGEGRAREWE